MNRLVAALLGALMVSAWGCGEPPQNEPSADVATPVPAQDTRTAIPAPIAARLPVSLNTVMVAMINPAADPLWIAAWRNPATDKDWRELERRAVQLELGGTLLSVPGTGPLDENWAASPKWQQWALQLRDIGTEAVAAVQARDIGGISAVGDAVVEICEGCHRDFKLAMPTGGEFGELSPSAAEFESDR